MSKGPWMRVDPKRDLRGATPEKLAAALFRRTEPLRPETRTRRKPVGGDHVTVEKATANKPRNRVPHLRKGV